MIVMDSGERERFTTEDTEDTEKYKSTGPFFSQGEASGIPTPSLKLRVLRVLRGESLPNSPKNRDDQEVR